MMAEIPRGPSTLALVQDPGSGPSLWRVLQPCLRLEEAGYPAAWTIKHDGMENVAALYDAIILPRMSWLPGQRRMAQAWFDSLRRAGKLVIYESDDDAFTSHETRRRVDLDWTDGKSFEQLETERHERIWAMQQCDGVTVSTPRLATIVRQYTDKSVIVVANAIDLKWFQSVVRTTKRQVPGITIGWAGGRRHDRDVEQMAEAWGRIAVRYPDVTFIVQGWLPDVIVAAVPKGRLIFLPWMPLEAYPSGIAQIDIGCCAVADTPFNRAKSNIKGMEYAAAGAAVVASPTLYSGLVDHGCSGFIAESATDWEVGLSTLIESHALRQIMAKRLLKTVQKHHSLETQLWRWPAAWATIAEAARRPVLFAPSAARARALTGVA